MPLGQRGSLSWRQVLAAWITLLSPRPEKWHMLAVHGGGAQGMCSAHNPPRPFVTRPACRAPVLSYDHARKRGRHQTKVLGPQR